MPARQISDAVKRLIADRIDSVPELEALLLLREYEAERWTAATVGARIYVSHARAQYILDTLAYRGFVAGEDGGGYRYAPVEEIQIAVRELASAYAAHLVEVTKLIHAKPTNSVRDFAEAFRLRKEK